MKLLSYNIRFGGLGREQGIASVIRSSKPDIVVLQEATQPDVVKSIGLEAEMEFWGSKQGHSVGFISRVPISRYEWRDSPALRRPFLEISPAGTRSLIFGVHLSAIHSNWTERRRLRELRALLECIRVHKDRFGILAGDFNTLAPGESLEMARLPRRLRVLAMLLGGRVRFRTIQMMLDEGYADAYRRIHSDEGFTFPTWDPHVRLDYFFVPSEHVDRVRSCEVLNEIPGVRDASDHFPLAAEIDIE